jgi:transposase-like protein
MAKGTTGNLTNLARHFSDEMAARTLLESLRWPNGVACPRCGGADPYKLAPKASGKNPARQGLYKCRACKKQFSSTTGTIFESSHVPLSKWLLALHLICASKKGMSAHQLHRMLNVTYRAAWFMNHRLRFAMSVDEGMFTKLTGVVEADETYVGARHKRGTKRGRPGIDSHKAPVIALVQRGGKVRAFTLGRVTSNTLRKELRAKVHPSATLMTDEYQVYNKVGKEFAGHEKVHHGSGEYVRGAAHVNSAEGFFSLLKRGINGSFHHVSKGHLHRYVSEFEFRHNTRTALGINDGERAAILVRGAEGKRLTYKMPSGNRAA